MILQRLIMISGRYTRNNAICRRVSAISLTTSAKSTTRLDIGTSPLSMVEEFFIMSEQRHASGPISLPPLIRFSRYHDAREATDQLVAIYERNTAFLRDAFGAYVAGETEQKVRVRACYPAIRIRVTTWQEVDTRLSFGHVVEPGTYMTTITQPALYYDYLLEQIALLIRHHGVPVEIGESDMPIPLHLAFTNGDVIESTDDVTGDTLRDRFDVPDLAVMDDAIVNGTWRADPDEPQPLAPFTAPRIDYSLHRLQHYT